LQEEFTTSINNFKKNFIIASRAVGERIGNLKVLTTGLTSVAEEGCSPNKRAKLEATCPDLAVRIGLLEAKVLALSSGGIAGNTDAEMKVGDKRAVDIID
jgi:hypothetical protein